ncbi:hypothetical protein GII30_20345 [Gordonia amarae]|uniref:Uncharacterized protein n=1 Tax=Gordonia amarae TaxID=36821 RepID=A0A857L2X4_9ACTN|nr:hypothetical protein [Gordonia amarae]MCS3880798.1 hypothetical protein [Gordonia amarae]QHN19079.1 hypothetical protein GII35_20695 [Gordonia amarae]QHN23554.1 hypothetical protein GII34_20195 [Gordonia amarae]QHN32454.1 hypothetical protein GII32_20510 [Gordonia amarae]QHN41203.1 hypothetical protein GII30_20345 [Gordonia amarae]
MKRTGETSALPEVLNCLCVAPVVRSPAGFGDDAGHSELGQLGDQSAKTQAPLAFRSYVDVGRAVNNDEMLDAQRRDRLNNQGVAAGIIAPVQLLLTWQQQRLHRGACTFLFAVFD